MSSGLPAEQKLSMSLDDLISAEKAQSKSVARDRSPRRSHENSARHRKSYDGDDNMDEMNRGRRSDGFRTRRMTDDRKLSTRDGLGDSRTKTVKVTNIPYDLAWKDVRDAFSSAGEIERCDVQKGTAWITFYDTHGAQKALRDYDGGDMNGRTIRVSLS